MRRLQAVMQSVSDALLELDCEGRVLSLNPAAERLLGSSQESLRGQSLGERCRFYREDKERTVQIDLLAEARAHDALRRSSPAPRVAGIVAKTGKSTNWQFAIAQSLQIKIDDRTPFPVEVTCNAIIDRAGDCAGVVLAMCQAGERRKSGAILDKDGNRKLNQWQEVRRDSEQRLRFALKAAELGEWEIDLKSGQARTSLEHDRCFGFKEPISDWSTEKFFAAVHADDRDEVRRIVRTAREADQVCRFECRVVWPDGSVHWIEAHSMIYPGADGKPSHVAGIVRDITARKEAEAAVQKAYRHRDEFLAYVSHEIRNPMASVMGYAELLSTVLKDPTEQEFVKVIKNNGDYLLTLINDLLDLAKMEAGKLEIVRQPTPLARLLDEVHTSMSARAHEKGLRLSLRVEGALPDTIEADPTRLRQVLINLIGNAIKFTDQGAVDLVVRYERNRALLEFEIADTGVGMVAEARHRLFEPFSQFSGRAELRQGGSGLGLAITSRLVGLMGGTIVCDSEFGKGSRFRVSVPATVVSGEVAAPSSVPPKSLSLSGRVLLIEDREEFAYFLQRQLESAGMEVVLCVDERTAMDAIRLAQRVARPFAIAIIEMPMSAADGYEVVRQLRAADSTMPIVALTASPFEQEVHQCYSAGCAAHLQKPFEPALLLETVARWRRAKQDARPRPKALNILLIDDNRVTCKSMRMLLEMGGHQVKIAYDGQTALTIAQEFHPDVVVSDIKLPDMDGFSLLRALHDLGGMDSTKFIALSGYAENEFRGAEPRFHHFLQKPLKLEELETLLSHN